MCAARRRLRRESGVVNACGVERGKAQRGCVLCCSAGDRRWGAFIQTCQAPGVCSGTLTRARLLPSRGELHGGSPQTKTSRGSRSQLFFVFPIPTTNTDSARPNVWPFRESIQVPYGPSILLRIALRGASCADARCMQVTSSDARRRRHAQPEFQERLDRDTDRAPPNRNNATTTSDCLRMPGTATSSRSATAALVRPPDAAR